MTGGVMMGPVFIPYQSFAILITALLSMGGLYLFSEFTLVGKALQASAMNRRGAQFCGIPVNATGATGLSAGGGIQRHQRHAARAADHRQL